MWMLEDLKTKTYELWANLHELLDCYYESNPTEKRFQQEVARYGNLGDRATWEAAYTHLKAQFLAEAATDDGQFLIEFHLIEAPRTEGWSDLTSAVIHQMLMFPIAVDALYKGYQKIRQYGCEYGADPMLVQELLGTALNDKLEPKQLELIPTAQ